MRILCTNDDGIHAPGLKILEQMPEDEVLARSTEDLLQQLMEAARIEPLVVATEPADGGVTETKVEAYDHFEQRRYKVAGLRIHAVYEFSGSPDLLYYAGGPNRIHRQQGCERRAR